MATHTITLRITETMSRTRQRFEERPPNPLLSGHTFYLRNEVWEALGQPSAITITVQHWLEGNSAPPQSHGGSP